MSPRVPIDRRAFVGIQAAMFQGGPCKLPVEIIVPCDENMTAEAFALQRGRLARISAEEVEMALILHISSLIDKGASDEELTKLAFISREP